MNRKNIQKVRDHIAGLPRERFNMLNWATRRGRYGADILPAAVAADCGTAACICGWAIVLLRPTEPDWFDAEAVGADLLGLTLSDACALFMPAGNTDNWSDITNAQAVRVLDHLLATGEVDWSVAKKRVRKSTPLPQSGGAK